MGYRTLAFDYENIQDSPSVIRCQISDTLLIFELYLDKDKRSYYMSIYDNKSNAIVKGGRVLTGVDLTLGVKDEALPGDYFFSAVPVNEKGYRSDLVYPMLGKDFEIAVLKR